MKFAKTVVSAFLFLLATAGISLSAEELKVFDWNGPASESDRGFPVNQPPLENGNWVSPINYSEGTYHIRIEIRGQPIAQSMRLQFCIWQEKNGSNFELESCTDLISITGSTGAVLTTSQLIRSMWKKDGNPIEWERARYRTGIAIKNSAGDPVSNFSGWNWNGEDPKEWYPLDMRYTVVVVSQGGTFSGWENYIDNVDGLQRPFNGSPHAIPGKIEGEAYDLGGQGIAYGDTTQGNTGGDYRSDDVDIFADAGASNGHVVGNSISGEWLEFTSNITAGRYDLILRYASNISTPGDLQVQIGDAPNGTRLSTVGTFTDIANSGGLDLFTTSRLKNVPLPGGDKVIRLQFVDGAGINIDSLNFVSTKPMLVPHLLITPTDPPRFSWGYDSTLTYRLEKSTNLSNWSADNRLLTYAGDNVSFDLTPLDLQVNTYFKILVSEPSN